MAEAAQLAIHPNRETTFEKFLDGRRQFVVVKPVLVRIDRATLFDQQSRVKSSSDEAQIGI
jgi:hypothetical protein